MKATVRNVNVGSANAVIINGTAHILKRSSSSYGLNIDGYRAQYCCQDRCCDAGLQSDVALLVELAKVFGATKVVIRTGQRDYYCREIAGLPVEDVSDHVGEIGEGIFIDRRQR